MPGTLHVLRDSTSAGVGEELEDHVPGFHEPAPELPSFARAVRDLRARITWDGRHARLAAHPLLAGLPRAEIRLWARGAEEVEWDPGQVILHQNGIGYWLVLILTGTATERRDGAAVATVGPGDQLGQLAAFGGRPQPTTVTADTHVRAFVIGRQRVACLIDRRPVIQRRLFPDMGTVDFVTYVRGLRAGAAAEWRAVGAVRGPVRTRPGRPPHLQITRPGRPVTPDPAWANVAAGLLGRRSATRPQQLTREPLSWRARSVIVGLGVLGVSLVGVLYHPPIAMVSPRPIDVSRDITVTGVPVHPVHGKYLLLAVRFERPNLFGVALAVALHRHHLSVGGPAVSATDRLQAEHQASLVFEQSQRDAAAAAARAAGFAVRLGGSGAIVTAPGSTASLEAGDVIVAASGRPVRTAADVNGLVGGPVTAIVVERAGQRSVFTVAIRGAPGSPFAVVTRDPTYTLPFRVTFRQRAIGGPSAGLVYALALADMLRPGDVAQGRTIAATGTIDPSGAVGPIGFADDKCRAARRAGTTALLVPAWTIAPGCTDAALVTSIDEALAALRSSPSAAVTAGSAD